MRLGGLVAALVIVATPPLTDAPARHPGAPASLPRPAVASADCGHPHGPLVAYGHSYLHSPRIGGAPASYAALAAGELGMKPVIRAVDQFTTPDTERLIERGPTRWIAGTSDLVLLDSGINDIRRRLPEATWTAALRRALTALSARPTPTILLVRPMRVSAPGHPGRDPKVLAAYAAAQRRVAAGFPNVQVVDASTGWDPRVDISREGVHPTAVGMARLARAVRGAAHSSCRA